MNFEKVAEAIHSGNRFIVTSHANPDGDALGSMLALSIGLKSLGKNVKIYSQDGVPSPLAFLPSADKVTRDLTLEERFDVGFIVDCAERERVGELFARTKNIAKLVIIDHHIKSDPSGDINLIDPKAPSTGELVLRLLQTMKIPIDREIAINVYCTLVADTGSFRYSNTTADVFKTAAMLVEKGADPWDVSRNLFDSYPANRLKALGMVLQTLEISPDGRYASIEVTRKMMQEASVDVETTEGFINYPRSIQSVEVAVQFREEEEGKVKVSFRSKDQVDVAALAHSFGGGGHIRAAGCTVEGPVKNVKRKILNAVEEVLK